MTRKTGRTGKPKVSPFEAARLERVDANRAKWAKRHPARAREQRQFRKEQATRQTSWEKQPSKRQMTPETYAGAERQKHNQGALARLHESGGINDDQLAWSAEIAAVAERIEADVAVRTASLEAAVDRTPGYDSSIWEGLKAVRAQLAYTRWRDMLPTPKRIVLDMIVGEPVGYSVAAARHHVHKRKARRMLIAALDRWPGCCEWARREIDGAELAAMQAGLMA
jgi:hypothetical protein